MMDPDAPAPPGVWTAPDKGRNGMASESSSELESAEATYQRPAKRRRSFFSNQPAESSSSNDSEAAESSEQ